MTSTRPALLFSVVLVAGVGATFWFAPDEGTPDTSIPLPFVRYRPFPPAMMKLTPEGDSPPVPVTDMAATGAIVEVGE